MSLWHFTCAPFNFILNFFQFSVILICLWVFLNLKSHWPILAHPLVYCICFNLPLWIFWWWKLGSDSIFFQFLDFGPLSFFLGFILGLSHVDHSKVEEISWKKASIHFFAKVNPEFRKLSWKWAKKWKNLKNHIFVALFGPLKGP